MPKQPDDLTREGDESQEKKAGLKIPVPTEEKFRESGQPSRLGGERCRQPHMGAHSPTQALEKHHPRR